MEDMEERASQAMSQLGFYAEDELRVLRQLTSKQSTASPRLISSFASTQGNDKPVPGGYILYMLMELLPGQPIRSFWRLSPAERQAIRDAFKTGYLDLIRCNVVSILAGIDNLVWDSDKRKIYIVDFKMTQEPKGYDRWTDSIWLLWCLALSNAEGREDMSQWTV